MLMNQIMMLQHFLLFLYDLHSDSMRLVLSRQEKGTFGNASFMVTSRIHQFFHKHYLQIPSTQHNVINSDT